MRVSGHTIRNRVLLAPAIVTTLLCCASLTLAECVDYGDPGADPDLVSFDLFPDGEVAALQMAGDIAWIARSFYGALVSVDLSDPGQPVLLGVEPVAVMDETYDVAVEGDLGFLTYIQWGGPAGVRIFDITDPYDPVDIADFPAPTGHWASYLAVQGDLLFVSFSYDLFAVLRIGADSAPELIGELTVDHPWQITPAGDRVYVATDGEPVIIDVTEPTAPALIGTLPTAADATQVAIGGDLAYAATDAGLEIFDVIDPTAPAAVGSLATPAFAISVDLGDGVVYVGVRDHGVYVVDVREPATPALLGVVDVPGLPWGVDEHGERLLVTAQSQLTIARRQCPLVPAGVDLPSPDRAPLLAASPNPFNPQTTIGFDLPAATTVDLGIYDLAGRRVAVLAQGEMRPPGHHAIVWRGRDERGRAVPSGTYVIHLETGFGVEAGLVSLVR